MAYPLPLTISPVLNLQIIIKFYQDHKEFIDNLISGALPAMIPVVAGFIWWLKWRHRQLRIPPSTFAFEVIKPHSADVMQRILGGDEKDSLADRNIRYQVRVANRSVRQELKQILEESRWVLILGRSGIGKTREATELVNYLNQEGWTVLFLKQGEWLDFPARMPVEIGTDRKLLFFIDDLNQKMYRSWDEISPEAEKSPVERFRVPLQERLLQALEKYEKFCGKAEIRVIATARNEQFADFEGEPTHWEKLRWDKYPQLWKRFTVYELAEPEEDAIIGLFCETVPNINIAAKVEDYPILARRNDRTFSNVVENLKRLKNDQLPLNPNTYRDTLKSTWEKRYKAAVHRYPISRYIYDAVDLLRQFDIELHQFTVEETAIMLANGNFWRYLLYRLQIRIAMNFLVHSERILEPRDGQIEAKGKQVKAEKYILIVSKLLVTLVNKHHVKMLNSLFNFGYEVSKLGYKQEAVTIYTVAINIKPDFYEAWHNKGNALSYLKQYEKAIAAYGEAIKIKPDFYEVFYSKGLTLRDLKRYEEAIVAYDEAIKIQSDFCEAWNDKGNALYHLGRYEEAIVAYDEAIKIQSDFYGAVNNKGNALFTLGRHEEAIAAYNEVININPDFYGAWYNIACCYAEQGNIDQAIYNLQQAINLEPQKSRQSAKNEPNFDSIRNDARFKALGL